MQPSMYRIFTRQCKDEFRRAMREPATRCRHLEAITPEMVAVVQPVRGKTEATPEQWAEALKRLARFRESVTAIIRQARAEDAACS